MYVSHKIRIFSDFMLTSEKTLIIIKLQFRQRLYERGETMKDDRGHGFYFLGLVLGMIIAEIVQAKLGLL